MRTSALMHALARDDRMQLRYVIALFGVKEKNRVSKSFFLYRKKFSFF